MSDEFRSLLRKVGSGTHTSKALTIEEARRAGHLMLTQEATPAQIGAFMIAHRIKRPTPEELAGMLDAYSDLGPTLSPIHSPVPPVVLNSPYDGRSRTMPLRPLTVLVLAAAGCPVITHGGDRMPTKYGIPLVELWQGLGLDWTRLSLEQVQHIFEHTRVAFIYTPVHHPLATGLVPYREQIGKRPPLATIELIWCPYAGESLVIAGFVHPPTENTAQYALTHRKTHRFIMVKGLEGSCDLLRDRTCIMGMGPGRIHPDTGLPTVDRFFLRPHEYGYNHKDLGLPDKAEIIPLYNAVLSGTPDTAIAQQLRDATIWNSGFYLWQSGCCTTMNDGIATAKELLADGLALKALQQVKRAIEAMVGAVV